MRTLNRIATVIVILGVCVVAFFMWCPYLIEEALDKSYQITVSWDRDSIRTVDVCKASDLEKAEQFADPNFSDPRYEFVPVRNGSTINVVQFKSGWNNIRLHHKFAVFRIEPVDGAVFWKIVPITPEVIRAKEIRIETGQ